MKRFLFAMLATLCVSCSPQAYTMLVEKKVPGETGVDLDGKSVCVVYVQNSSQNDSIFSSNFSDGLAQGIENIYFDGKKAVEVFSIPQESGEKYSERDSLANLVMATDADVIMLVDMPVSTPYTSEKDKCTANVFIYDSMTKEDKVIPVTSVSSVTKAEVNQNTFASDALFMGFNVGSKFTVGWETEQYTLLYFQGIDQRWMSAIEAVFSGMLDEAVSLWMELADDPKNILRSSCAEYNIAVVCHLTGNDKLALEWLSRSDKDYPISLSSGLRKKIEAAQ